MKRHAHIYKDSDASHSAFKDFIAGNGYQRCDSGMWYSSHDDTHNFFSADQPDKLRGVRWDTVEIAKDVHPRIKEFIISNYMDGGFRSRNGLTIAELPYRQRLPQQEVDASSPRLVVGRIASWLGQGRHLRISRLLPRNTVTEL